MASLKRRGRHRQTSAGGVNSQDKLKDALNEIRSGALQQGLSDDDFSRCLSSAASQHGITLGQRKPNTISCRSVLKLCWIVTLVLVLGMTLVAYSPLGFQVQRTVHSGLYDVVRSTRFAVIAISPYLKLLHLDFLQQDCLVQNPFGSQTCPCDQGNAMEVVLTDDLTIPVEVLDSQHPTTVVRNAVNSDFELKLIQDFHRFTGKNPPACMQVSDEGLKGPNFYQQLFDKEQMDEYLSLAVPWSFSWQECPDPSTGLSFRAVLPPQTYLPPHVNVSTDSMFSIGTQWVLSSYFNSVLPLPVAIVTVLSGEVRFSLSIVQENCWDVCEGPASSVVLRAGDLLIFNQDFWTYHSRTWSNLSVVYTYTVQGNKDSQLTNN